MRRLRDEALDAGSTARELVELVTAIEPFKPNPFRKRLVYQRIMRGEFRARRGWLLAPAFGSIALYLFGCVGIAAAAYGWWSHDREPKAHEQAPAVAPVKAPSIIAPQPTRPRSAPAAPADAQLGASSLPASDPATANVQARRLEPRPATQHEAKASVADRGEDPSEVLEAIRALRKQGDAARAQVLLDQYLKSHPSGALREDALVLSIEAAVARHDPRATEYAKRYLTRFPRGRFRAFAERVANRE